MEEENIFDIEHYIEEYIEKAETLIRKGLWSKIDIHSFKKWKEQFENTDDLYFAAYMVSKLIYYSDKDYQALLRFCLMNIIRREAVKRIKCSITEVNDDMWKKYVNCVCKTVAIFPLAIEDPTGSAYFTSRKIRDLNLGISSANFFMTAKLPEIIKDSRFDTIVFVDDIIGSGEQAEIFFKEKIGDTRISEILKSTEKSKYLAVALANQEAIGSLEKLSGCSIICAETITKENSTLFKEFWQNEDDFQRSIFFFEKMLDKYNIKQKGFKCNSWNIAFSHGVPDITCPFYSHENESWAPLIPTKGEAI